MGHGDERVCLSPKEVAGDLSKKICIEVSCGGLHTVVVTQDACVYSFGAGHEGQLGLGSERMTELVVPVRVEMPDFADGDEGVACSDSEEDGTQKWIGNID